MQVLRSIAFIKVVHTVIFFFLSGCVGMVLYSAIADRITPGTWVAFGLVCIEGAVLVSNGWRCPLATYTERLGAARGSVSDIFLPQWFAQRISIVCGSIFGISVAILMMRVFL